MERERLVVHGSGGHGRVVTAAALALGYAVKPTDARDGTEPTLDEECIIAIGDNAIRKAFQNRRLRSVIHPTAYVDPSARIENGVFIGPGAIVHVGARVGRGAIINTGSIVEHDCTVGEWAHLAPGAVLCGTVEVGEGAFVGAGSVVRENIRISPWATIGAGSAVVADIEEPGVYVGCPARKR